MNVEPGATASPAEDLCNADGKLWNSSGVLPGTVQKRLLDANIRHLYEVSVRDTQKLLKRFFHLTEIETNLLPVMVVDDVG